MSGAASKTCEHCHWFRRGTAETRDSRRVPGDRGLCMHSPPTATGEAGLGKWPIVGLNHWCGQWQEKATG